MLSAGNGFIMQSEKYSRDNAGQSLKKYTLLKKGELAYNHGASKAKQFGCCYQLEFDEALVPFVYHCFSVNKEYAPYISTVLNISTTERQLKRLVSSSVRMDGLLNISYDDYMTVELALPSMDEQQKVFCFLSLLEEKIKKQQQLVEHLKKYKRGVSDKIFSEADGWDHVAFLDVFSTVPDKPYQVTTSEYYDSGIYEVVDQGKNDIVGYNNDKSKVFNAIPIIVYGDHTTIIKYRNTPFIVGGDGVKLLTTETNNNLQYLFYALCQYNIQPEGYKRHFSIVKHLDIPIPSLEKQQIIAKTLATLDMKIQKESCLLENLLMQKKAIIKNLFI